MRTCAVVLDADTLIFMIRGLKSSNRHQASRAWAQKLVDRCHQAQAEGDTLAVSAITVAKPELGARQSDRPDSKTDGGVGPLICPRA